MQATRIELIIMAVLFLAITLASIPILLHRRNDAFVIIFFLYGLFFLMGIRCLRGIWKPVSWNLAIVMFCLAGAEAYFAGFAAEGTGKPRIRYSDPSYFQSDDALGYHPRKDVRVNAHKTFHGKDIYDVHYTINPQGFRQGKSIEGEAPPSVLFFGGSFTFGEGLEDDQTIAWQFQESTGDTIQGINLGFHGYGPHQMLKILEDHREKDVVSGTKPILAIYLCIDDHLRRIAGKAYWDSYGPCYVLQEDGDTKYKGPFNTKVTANVLRVFSRSQLYREIESRFRKNNDDQAELLAGIVNTSREILRERYDIDLIVLVHGRGKNTNSLKLIRDQLESHDFKIMDFSALLPEFNPQDPEWYIAGDEHPSAISNQRLAQALAEQLKLAAPLDP